MNFDDDADDFATITRRLCVLKDFPFFIEGERELMRALMEASGDNPEFANQIVSSFIEDGGQCPDPRAIKTRAYQILHPGGAPPLGSVQCPKCRGTGWVSFTKRKKFINEMVDYDYAAKCECRGGRPLEEPPPDKALPPAPFNPDEDMKRLLAKLVAAKKKWSRR